MFQKYSHTNCPFCGKEFTSKTITNGEHLFPAFACKQIFGVSEGSKHLQEKIKIKVCKECNSKYGINLETKLKNIINAISTNNENFIFRTEEALTLLDYMTKTRVLLSFRANRNFDQKLGNYDTITKSTPADRQLFIVKGPVPDGIYIPKLKNKSELVSTENFDVPSCFAVVINGVILISFENKLVSEALGFPFTVAAWIKDGLLLDQHRQIMEFANFGHKEISDMWFSELLKKTPFVNSVILSQPRVSWSIDEYTKKYMLSKAQNGYIYGVYYNTKNKSGWLLKQNNEKGSKGINVYDIPNDITLPKLEKFLLEICVQELASYSLYYTYRASPHDMEEKTDLISNILDGFEYDSVESILAFENDELQLYRDALKFLLTFNFTKEQIIKRLYKLVKYINDQKVTTNGTQEKTLKIFKFDTSAEVIKNIIKR